MARAYVKIEYELHEWLSWSAAVLYKTLRDFNDKPIWMNKEQFAELVHMTPKEFRTAKRELENIGLLHTSMSDGRLHYDVREIDDKIPKRQRGAQKGKECPKGHPNHAQKGTTDLPKRAPQPCPKGHPAIYNVLQDNTHNNITQQGYITAQPTEERPQDAMLQTWAEFYRNKFGTEYHPDWRTQTDDWLSLVAAVREKMNEHGRPWETETAKSFFGELLEAMYQNGDEWQRQHFTLRTLVSQFNNLYNNITNGKSKQTLPGTNISAEYLARQLAILGE